MDKYKLAENKEVKDVFFYYFAISPIFPLFRLIFFSSLVKKNLEVKLFAF